MPQQVQGVIARSKGAPVELVDITIPDPGPNDVVVRIQACGVCHTDLTYRDGGINDEFPFLLGHEAAGIVEIGRKRGHPCRGRRLRRAELASGVRQLPGMPARPAVVLLRHLQCRPADDAGRRHGVDARRWASARSRTKPLCTRDNARRSIRTPIPRWSGLLGCGVMAGLGAAVNTGNVSRGDSVAVIGCGGVGDAAIAGARLAGASPIIAIDRDPKKLQMGDRIRRHPHDRCRRRRTPWRRCRN